MPGLVLVLLALVVAPTPVFSAPACPPEAGVAVQVLGSGGPVADDGRASSAYLVWVQGAARILVDAGGGPFLRFGEAGARFEDLELIALSHFHTDHSADVPALLKSGYFSDRRRALVIAGPDGQGAFPGLGAWLGSLLGPDGAYAYLGGYLDGSDGLVRLEPVTVPSRATEAKRVLGRDDLSVEALGVPHGIVPSIAFRVRVGDKVVVFGSDQNGTSVDFRAFARDADLLVAHLAIPETASGAATRLHARPSVIGALARDAGARQLLLSHFMARSLHDLDSQLDEIRTRYPGPLHLARDLVCVVP